MADINEILGRQINSVKELKSAIKELQDSLVGVDAESEEFKTTTQQLAAAQAELNKVTRAGKDENIAAKDSIAGMEKEYRNLYNTYKMLSEEQRNSDFGKNMASSLETLSTKLNDSKKEVGNFKDNIGRYSESVVDAFNKMGISLGGLKGPLQVASNGTKGLNTAFKALAANPLMLALTALVAIFMKVAAAIKQNEELTDRLKQALSVFQPVLNAISNAFDFLANILVKVVEGIAKVGEKVLSIIPGFKKATKETQALAKAQDDLNKKQREASVENSKKQAEVARLREEASATEDVMEKKRLLEEAKEKQREIDEENIRLAQEELDILQRQSELTANSAADNDALAAAQKKVNDAVAQGASNMRQYNKELGKVENQVNKTTGGGGGKSKAQQEREEVEKLAKELDEFYKTDEQKLAERYEKEKKLMVKYGVDTSNLDKKYAKDHLEIVVKTTNEKLEKERESYAASLRQYSRYIEQQRAILKDNPVELANFDKRISEEIITRFKKIEGAAIATQKKLFELKDDSAFNLDDSINLVNAFSLVLKRGNAQMLTDFDATLELIKGKIADYANAGEGTMEEIIKKGYEEQLKAVEKLGPEEWAKIMKPIQDQVDSLEKAYGVTIGTLEEVGRLTEIEENNLKALKKAFTEALGKEQIDRIEEVIKDANEASMQLELDMLKNTDTDNYVKLFRDLGQLMAENTYDTLSAQKVAYEEELLSFSGTQEQKLEIMYKYYDVVKQMQENNLNLQELNRQRTIEMFESLIDLSDRIGSAMSTYRSAQEQMIESQLKAGKIDEDEAKKKKKRLLDLQKVETAFNIATIVADAASGLFSIWKGYAMEVGTINPQTAAATGPAAAGTLAGLNAKSLITAIAKSAGLAATATAQVAAARGGYISAKNNLAAESSGGGSGSGSGTGVASTPYLIDSQPFSYTRTLQTEQEEALNDRPIVCSVVDIEDAMDARRVRITESSF